MRKVILGILVIIGLSLITSYFVGNQQSEIHDAYIIPIQAGDLEIAKQALEEEISYGVSDSLLEYGVYEGHEIMVKTLLEAGANPLDNLDPWDNAIMLALSQGHENILKIFEEYGFETASWRAKHAKFEAVMASIEATEKLKARDADKSALGLLLGTLRSPSSYSEVASEAVWSGLDENGNVAVIYRMEYDAENGFGAQMRGCNYISFWLEGGDIVRYYPNSFADLCSAWDVGGRDRAVESLVRINFFRQANQ